jgi:hypothetical protein
VALFKEGGSRSTSSGDSRNALIKVENVLQKRISIIDLNHSRILFCMHNNICYQTQVRWYLFDLTIVRYSIDLLQPLICSFPSIAMLRSFFPTSFSCQGVFTKDPPVLLNWVNPPTHASRPLSDGSRLHTLRLIQTSKFRDWFCIKLVHLSQ